jgi:hypothetical protein
MLKYLASYTPAACNNVYAGLAILNPLALGQILTSRKQYIRDLYKLMVTNKLMDHGS